MTEAIDRVLERELKPLLLLGAQAHEYHSDYCHVGHPDQTNWPDHCECNKPKWDAALASKERPAERGKDVR